MATPRTEAEWRTADDPRPMLNCLQHRKWHRKLHLFAAGCCRRAWDIIPLGPCRDVVVAVEMYADGRLTKGELYHAGGAAYEVLRSTGWHGATIFGTVVQQGAWAAWNATSPAARAARETSRHIQLGVGQAIVERSQGEHWHAVQVRQDRAEVQEREAQAGLVREIVGSPFEAEAISPAMLTRTVTAIAQGIYADRAFDRMPILGDALQDAGVIDESILLHCRHTGGHALGCWLIDLLLNMDPRQPRKRM